MIPRYNETQLDTLVAILNDNGAISVPTDTVFGVCAKASSIQAQEHLRDVKNRPKDKAFPIMCANRSQIEELCVVDDRTKKLIDAFMPGPVTFVLKKKENIPEDINGGLPTIAIRMATSKPLEYIIEQTGPLFMTSANQSGQQVATTLDEIEEVCPLLDGMLEGEPQFGKASTIVDCTGELKILREGPITLEELNAVVKE